MGAQGAAAQLYLCTRAIPTLQIAMAKAMKAMKAAAVPKVMKKKAAMKAMKAAAAPKVMKKKAAMKAMSVKALPKSGIADALATATGFKKAQCAGCLDALTELATKEVSKGKFTIPGLVMIKTRVKPATKAGTRLAFGKMMAVKAKPARTIVKAFAVKALKNCV